MLARARRVPKRCRHSAQETEVLKVLQAYEKFSEFGTAFTRYSVDLTFG
jgi:hypothetical protein